MGKPGDEAGAAAHITPGHRRYALAVLVLVYISSHVDRNILGILLQPIKEDLKLSDTALGFLTGTAFAIFYATLGVPVAWLADRGNRRNIIAIAIALWSAMTALCGLSQNFLQLALARIGVGIGEAGSSPPSHSIISDLYPPRQRSSAMAIYALGVYIGAMLGYLVGGYVSHDVGWRATFFVVGLPGLAIALLVRWTLREPPRGHSEGLPIAQGARMPIWHGFRNLWRSPAMRHLVFGCTLTSFVGYGGLNWNAAYLVRSLGMNQAQVGEFLALTVGIFGGLGAIFGGRIADFLAARDMRWNAWIVSVTKLVSVPLLVAFYLAPDMTFAFMVFAPAVVLGAVYLGPTFAMVQSLTPANGRAMAAAVLLLILNLIGLGLGPQLVGILSDLMSPRLGGDSLRYALLGVAFINVWAAGHYVAGGIHYRREMKAREAGAV